MIYSALEFVSNKVELHASKKETHLLVIYKKQRNNRSTRNTELYNGTRL